MNRLLFNKKILKILIKLVKQNPDMRFIQILWAAGLISLSQNGTIDDRFYEEPDITLSKMIENPINRCHR